ncbi:hypothetical protein [Emticicia sp. BO119]|uniref:hypothetical protein n=1 Tax=Emticicia sp. BO119 TaxID=2757768 RepID=UPI0015F029A1|nr:hypothetical protein [Emticicia sp. BO119]MBA4849632.1 hypothetical protein [Emticicia sp. BO119]
MLLRDQVIGVGEGDGNILVNTHLAIEGVNVMNGFLKETINNKGFNGLLSVTIAGFTSPESAKIIADLKLNIKCNIEYWYCEQSYVPIFLDFVDEESE